MNKRYRTRPPKAKRARLLRGNPLPLCYHGKLSPRICYTGGVLHTAPVGIQVILGLGQLLRAWERSRHADAMTRAWRNGVGGRNGNVLVVVLPIEQDQSAPTVVDVVRIGWSPPQGGLREIKRVTTMPSQSGETDRSWRVSLFFLSRFRGGKPRLSGA